MEVDCTLMPYRTSGAAAFIAEWLTGPACLVGQTGTINYYEPEPSAPSGGWWEGGAGFISGGLSGTIGVCGDHSCYGTEPAVDWNWAGWNISFACGDGVEYTLNRLYALGFLSAPPGLCVGGDPDCCTYLHIPDIYIPGIHRFHVLSVSYAPVVIDLLMDWYVPALYSLGEPPEDTCEDNPWGPSVPPDDPNYGPSFTATLRLTETP